ncbi:hypothetical protein Tco_0505606 [Tanacetum coccineum]
MLKQEFSNLESNKLRTFEIDVKGGSSYDSRVLLLYHSAFISAWLALIKDELSLARNVREAVGLLKQDDDDAAGDASSDVSDAAAKFALMGLSSQVKLEKLNDQVKLEESKARFDKWKESSKNLDKLINSSMSSRSKFVSEFGRNFDQMRFDPSAPSIFDTTPEDVEGKPLYDRFVKAVGMHVVPSPITGTFMPPSNKPDLDDTQVTYGSKSNNYFETNSVSNDFVSCENSDKSSDSETTGFASCVSSVKSSSSKTNEHLASASSSVDFKTVSKTADQKPSSTIDDPSFSFKKNVKTPRNICNKSGINNRSHCKNNSFGSKTCFVCGSKFYLIKDCDFYEQQLGLYNKPMWHNVANIPSFVPRVAYVPAGSRNPPASVSAGSAFPAGSRNRPASVSAGRPFSAALKVALTHDHHHLDSLVKQFWSTASSGLLISPSSILAKRLKDTLYTITEDTVRSQLQLGDDGGIKDLPIANIYLGMNNLGYPTEGKLTFHKSKFSPQWRRFNWSSYIFKGMVNNISNAKSKLFANMRLNFEGGHMPLLAAMLPPAQATIADDGTGEAALDVPQTIPETIQETRPEPDQSQEHIPTPPRLTTRDQFPPVFEQGHTSDLNIASFSGARESDPDLFTSTNMEDATLGGSFHTTPPRSIPVPPVGPTSGGAEDLATLTALSSLVSELVRKEEEQDVDPLIKLAKAAATSDAHVDVSPGADIPPSPPLPTGMSAGVSSGVSTGLVRKLQKIIEEEHADFGKTESRDASEKETGSALNLLKEEELFAGTKSTSIYTTGWTMKHVKSLSDEQLKSEFEKIRTAVADRQSQNIRRTLKRAGEALEHDGHTYGTRRKSLETRKKSSTILDLDADDRSFIRVLSDDDSDDADDPVIFWSAFTTWEVVPTPLGDINALYMMDRSSKYFTHLREILHLVDRQDLLKLYGMVVKYYEDHPLAGAGYESLLGDSSSTV